MVYDDVVVIKERRHHTNIYEFEKYIENAVAYMCTKIKIRFSF